MAEDPNPALRAVITAARDHLDPQIRGLRALASIDFISPELQAAANGEADNRQRRRDLEQAVLNRLDSVVAALEALEADGYPALPNTAILATLYAELRRQIAELQGAADVFTGAMAATMSIVLGEPQPKSDP